MMMIKYEEILGSNLGFDPILKLADGKITVSDSAGNIYYSIIPPENLQLMTMGIVSNWLVYGQLDGEKINAEIAALVDADKKAWVRVNQ